MDEQMNEEIYERICNVINNEEELISELENYLSDYSSPIQIYYDYQEYETIYDENYNPDIPALGIAMMNDYMKNPEIKEQFERLTAKLPLSEEEKIILIALFITNKVQASIDQRMAYNYGEIYRSDKEMIEQYGSKNKAYDKGFEDYMDRHIYSKISFLDKIINKFLRNTQVKL